MASIKERLFKKRQLRVRNKLRKTAYGKMRLSVHRSSKNLYAQIIDDKEGKTIVAVSTLEKKLGFVGKNNMEVAVALLILTLIKTALAN